MTRSHPVTDDAVTPEARLREAAQDVVTHWFDLVEGDADEALRRSLLTLREALAIPPVVEPPPTDESV
jgi:hypothetical protein